MGLIAALPAPACYELGLGGPRYGNIQPVYIGETANERRRLTLYAQHGSHLARIIDDHLKKGFTLYYRAVALRTKEDAKDMQDNLLAKYDYDWNILFNPKD